MQNYNAKSIEVLTGLDPVKKRPGMYTNTENPNHLIQEIVDNSVDEVLAGYASKINITLYDDNSIEVADDGRGMPVDIHPEHKMSGIELIMTKLHSGGKFSNKNYTHSGGLHGVGVSVVNALSSKLEAEIKRDGNVYQITFEDGLKTKDLEIIDSVGKKNTGTKIRFWPNKKYFDDIKVNVKALKNLLEAKAILCKALTIKYSNEIKKERISWHFETGLKGYLDHKLEAETLPLEPFMIDNFSNGDSYLDAVFCWCEDPLESIKNSYVNLIPTPQDGTHVTGLKNGVYEAIKTYIEKNSLGIKNVKITANDSFAKLNYVISVKITNPQFAGQTKEKLSNKDVTSFVTTAVKDLLTIWLNQNPDEARQIIENINSIAQKRINADKKTTRKRIMNTSIRLPGKLTDCISSDINSTELFIVEGDSAGGSAKQARDKNFQAVLPLKGKILNSWELDADTIMNSQEVHNIATAIGVDPDSDDISGLRYNKICILADADSDGLHIATLLCAMFLKHFRKLIEYGHIYIAQPPLFRIDIGKNTFYALDENEKEKILAENAKLTGKINIMRFKGLGEMNPIQLRESAMDVSSRRLLQLTISNTYDDAEILDMLLAKKRAKDRRDWLENHGDKAEIE
ncbi:DNA topoisomerase IV subunit B [Francisella philomiragia]|uniref:DNA topoisomerase 4 subunit B n=1 Tax=Francisella philomiragia subsp. philomiragia (strain ATCC 25017 / CCUG 19701 / FSC 153 / O\|nr:DNA topoisomerase IV subunit B [Francisella philomiragia]AJI47781.1 DNA topoisomerase IV, B subunit [Francisella philomiragia]AJI48646.1 DNA topoisomerase IV, B subunit [Francisella philomiragia]MBK2020434.1 DNA topoisomerase IV subunit B [Francisella philomiragia]MBK2030134.1 DNA topoisomerase IV subunit B [Francisella philomiragia]MBK2263131.1 DNA topoisomerase IV subunit B [Francisella philomiragia]